MSNGQSVDGCWPCASLCQVSALWVLEELCHVKGSSKRLSTCQDAGNFTSIGLMLSLGQIEGENKIPITKALREKKSIWVSLDESNKSAQTWTIAGGTKRTWRVLERPFWSPQRVFVMSVAGGKDIAGSQSNLWLVWQGLFLTWLVTLSESFSCFLHQKGPDSERG